MRVKAAEEVKEEVTLSEEDMDLLRKNIRPEWMPYDMYKEIRRRGDDAIRTYLRGKFIHVSSNISEEEVEKPVYKYDEELNKRVKVAGKIKMNIRRTAKPYIRPKV